MSTAGDSPDGQSPPQPTEPPQAPLTPPGRPSVPPQPGQAQDQGADAADGVGRPAEPAGPYNPNPVPDPYNSGPGPGPYNPGPYNPGPYGAAPYGGGPAGAPLFGAPAAAGAQGPPGTPAGPPFQGQVPMQPAHPGTPTGWPVPPFAPQNPDTLEKPKGRGCLITVLAVVFVVAATLGTACWFIFGLGQGKELWRAEYQGPDDDKQNYMATWFSGKNVVRGQANGLTAYDQATGAEKWKVPLVAGGAQLCASSSVTSEDIAVVAYGKPGSCNFAAAVDLKKARTLWELPLDKKDLSDESDGEPSLAVSDGVVVVDDKSAYKLRDGSKAWSNKQLTKGSGDCTAGTYTGGAKLVRTQACSLEEDEFDDPVKGKYTVAEIDPETGDPKWMYNQEKASSLDSGPTDGDVLSTSPITVREGNKYRILSGGGKPRGLVKIKDYKATGQSETPHLGNPAPGLKASGDTLVVEDRSDGDERIEAFDMDSGKRVWGTEPDPGVQYDLVQGEDGRLLAKKEDNDNFSLESGEEPFSVIEFDPATGDESEIQDFANLGDVLGHAPTPYMHGGRLYLSSVTYQSAAGELHDMPSMDTPEESMIVLDS